MTALDEGLDHLLHRLDLVRGARADVRVEHAEAVHLLDEGRRALLGDLGGGATSLVGPVDDLVVHVREVLRERDLVALVHQVAANHVEREERARVADVNLVVDGGSADVHADLALLEGDELLLLVRLAVVDEHACSLAYTVRNVLTSIRRGTRRERAREGGPGRR